MQMHNHKKEIALRQIKSVTHLAIATNIALFVLKLSAGLLSGSMCTVILTGRVICSCRVVSRLSAISCAAAISKPGSTRMWRSRKTSLPTVRVLSLCHWRIRPSELIICFICSIVRESTARSVSSPTHSAIILAPMRIIIRPTTIAAIRSPCT